MNSQADSEKKFYIHTIGCKVNQYESQAMREILIRAGFVECLSKEAADIYIVNTCTVTHHADKESRYLIGMLHKTNPAARIVVAGCYVERNADDISLFPGVSHIVKNEEKGAIDKILNGSRQRTPADLTVTGFNGHTKAFVKIQDGCENRCSYCKVPLVRGELASKPLDRVVSEVRGLVQRGFKEIVLTGICLGAWGSDIFPKEILDSVGLKGAGLVDVLKAIEKIDGGFRIRLSSIEAKYVTDELIELIASSKKICRHLHIPLQSGDDKVLKLMNRPYTTADYMALIAKIRGSMADIAISTDIMVGFPGEDDASFVNTLNFIKAVAPSRTHIFTYSRRDGTAASAMSGEVSEEAAKRRYYNLRTIAMMLSYLYRARYTGRPIDVLVESRRDKQTGLLTGYSANYIKILFNGPDEIMGRIVPVRVESVNLANTLGAYESN